MNITKANVMARPISCQPIDDKEDPADAVLRGLEAPNTHRHRARAYRVLSAISREERATESHKRLKKSVKGS